MISSARFSSIDSASQQFKFAFCLFRYYPFGGLERDCIRIANECVARGFSVDIYTMGWEGIIPEGIPIKQIFSRGITNHGRCLSFVRRLKQHLKSCNYDLIVGFNRMPGLDVYFAADTCYAASVRQRHGAWYLITPRYRGFAALEKAVFSPLELTKILLLSAPEQQRIMQYYGTSAERFHLLPPGIDRSNISRIEVPRVREEMRTQLKIGAEQHFLLTVGSDFKRKGLDRALAALASLPENIRKNTKLLVVGKGNAVPFLQMVQALNIEQQVIFAGPRNDVAKLMLAADVLLHPAYEENAGKVILEAIAAGLPVLVTENCGYAFHVKEAQAGFLVPMPYHQGILNDFLLNMLSPLIRLPLKENALRYAEKNDLYSLPERAVDLLVQFSKDKINRIQESSSVNVPKARAETLWLKPQLLLNSNVLGHEEDLFNSVFQLEGKIFRQVKNRKTLRFENNNKGYFVKLHQGVGWKEIFKNLLLGRWPILGAQHEWRAIQRFKQLGVPTMNLAGYGQRGSNPAHLQSFVITEEIVNSVSLEDFSRNWPSERPSITLKRKLIAEVAKIARSLHANGVNHRDFYICHFLMASDEEEKRNDVKLYVIDLHRVQFFFRSTKRFIVYDLVWLYFCCFYLCVLICDFFYFIKEY